MTNETNESPPKIFQYFAMQSIVSSTTVWPEFQCQLPLNSTSPLNGIKFTVDMGVENGINENCRLHIPFRLRPTT